ncbi:RNA polymerase II associated Paf1 complex component PAF1 [Babesia ovata]|uniref:RNA polymerase II associated Paf1 complex component PAF1 n=1 Tax=Babesia ovata TaxID=189622 RepID=A0A2H6K989_9APIC|nr:RNA polymerase II associated Paf1 complex component PAF1 [Babesia ovata]GBE59538.1 RNA polymerase II associated Paf1 complex component PAF1 [Babesia ovata]
MSKRKEGGEGGTKSEPVDTLSAYLQKKSPLLGSLEFDTSIPEPPVDANLLTYDLNEDAIAYELSALELYAGFTSFHDFENGVVCESLEPAAYSNYAIENQELLDELGALAQTLNVAGMERLSQLRAESLQTPEMQTLYPLIKKLRDAMPNDVRHVLFAAEGVESKGAPVERIQATQPDSGPDDHEDAVREKWSSMSIGERIEHHISQINDTFVPVSALKHPTNPKAKIAKHYKVMPNVGLWKNRYVQVGVDGVTSASATEGAGKLAVGGILHVAKDSATHRLYEYYKSTTGDEEQDVKHIPGSQELFKFVRMYSCQQSTKIEGNDNYFLLSLPPRLHSKVKSGIFASNGASPRPEEMDIDVDAEDDLADSVVHILPVKGQKIVLTKAGKAKVPDIMLTYTEDILPSQG